MANEKRHSSDQGLNSQRGSARDQGLDSGAQPMGTTSKKPSLAEVHGKGISATSSHDLVGNLRGTEGSLVGQGEPQPSGGATGTRPQMGSFESGQRDTGPGVRGEDRLHEERGSLEPGTHGRKEI
jgi:hypothetical protein